MLILVSKDPVWSEKESAHILDFKGKVKKPSIKNFILIEKESNEEIVIFGKISDNLYSLNVSWPLSIYQAFALAITSIAFKVGCQ